MTRARQFSFQKRLRIYFRDLFTCQYCKTPLSPLSEDLTLDHVDPKGDDSDENLVTACRSCNSAKGNRTWVAVLDRQSLLDAIGERLPRAPATPEQLFKRTCGRWGLTPEQLLSANRSRHYVQARAELAHGLRDAGFSLAGIARFLNKTHSTIVHLLKAYPQGAAVNSGDGSSQSEP